jgi:CelD/BcsL family acetyltransferase involved in cellulose biosynthesis
MLIMSQNTPMAELVSSNIIEKAMVRSGTLVVQVMTLEASASTWLSFENSASPYQRFDWATAYESALNNHEGLTFKVMVIRSETGQPMMILPLVIKQAYGLCIAAPIGGKHANLHLPLYDNLALSKTTPLALKQAIQRGLKDYLKVDLLTFMNSPLEWEGCANPMVFGIFGPSPSNAYKMTLDSDPEITLKRAFSKDSRKKLRQKEQKLEALGKVAHLVAHDSEDVRKILNAFLSQKAERFAKSGLVDPFADTSIHGFLEQAATNKLQEGKAALELHALKLDDKIIAVIGGAVDHRRFSGMFMSFDMDADIARSSPGDLLLQKLIADQCMKGRITLDLGVGEARYKSSHCDGTEYLVDVLIPANIKGYVTAHILKTAQDVKRWIKHKPWAYKMVQKMMKVCIA